LWYNKEAKISERKKTKMEFINDFNLKKQADDLGIKVWQTPGFLFIIMGILTVVVMLGTYFVSRNYNNPEILVIAESLVVIITLTIGTSVVRFVDQITRLNKAKSEFVSLASHQLRTPLSAIKWETELLLTKFKKGLNKKQMDNVESISILSQRMIRMVNDLLDVARIDQNRLILRKQNFNFMNNVKNVLADLEPIAKKRNISIVFVAKKNLPNAIGDPEKINLAVENITSNAIKYTTSGGKVEVKISKNGNFLVFDAKDNGVGIPREQHSRVFEKFFRSDNAVKYQTEGTGLGLYIAKNIIEQLGGEMWFQSIENVGSIFSFSLPIAKK
jgi:signal transduction histidine kinase